MALLGGLLKSLPRPYFPRCRFSNLTKHGEVGSKIQPKLSLDSSEVSRICSEISSVNSRLSNLELTGAFLSGNLNLTKFCLEPSREIRLPEAAKTVVKAPTAQHVVAKNFIVETPVKILDPVREIKKIEEPVKKRHKKHAVRMIVLRRRKMKKHQLKRLRKRMHLRFRSNYVKREKKKELAFRYMLMDKIAVARKFDAEKYVSSYLTDYHTPLLPKTYKGSRKPAWLIKELLEQDILDEKQKAMEGKSLTTKETLVRPGETVQEFIKRNWNK